MKKADCYGTMFPEVQHITYNKKYTGKVFSFSIDHIPINKKDINMNIDENEWENCCNCSDYSKCYDFSMAKWAFSSNLLNL